MGSAYCKDLWRRFSHLSSLWKHHARSRCHHRPLAGREDPPPSHQYRPCPARAHMRVTALRSTRNSRVGFSRSNRSNGRTRGKNTKELAFSGLACATAPFCALRRKASRIPRPHSGLPLAPWTAASSEVSICHRRLAGDAHCNPTTSPAPALATSPQQRHRCLRIDWSITHSLD